MSNQPAQTGSYRELLVWQKAMDLVEATYRLTRRFPASERFGLSSQMQRAAVSVPANIAEGRGRKHLAEYLHHLSVANGSLKELETHILIAERLRYAAPADWQALMPQAEEVGRMLAGLMDKLEIRKGPR
jgi:four helix bundle protein